MDRVTEALDWVVDRNPDYPVMIEIDKDDAKSHLAELATLRAENERLREALEFYADRGYDGYDVEIGDYGLSMRTGKIILDGGDKAKEALK